MYVNLQAMKIRKQILQWILLIAKSWHRLVVDLKDTMTIFFKNNSNDNNH